MFPLFRFPLYHFLNLRHFLVGTKKVVHRGLSVQWGLEYQTKSVFGCFKVVRFESRPFKNQTKLAQVVLYYKYFFKYKTVQANWAILFFNHSKSERNVLFLHGQKKNTMAAVSQIVLYINFFSLYKNDLAQSGHFGKFGFRMVRSSCECTGTDNSKTEPF